MNIIWIISIARLHYLCKKVLYSKLIQKGGGKGPMKPWQPALWQGANSCLQLQGR